MIEHETRLLCGLNISEKEVIRTATFREMTGSTQKIMGNPDIQRKPGTLLRAIVQDCLIKIGDKPCTSALIDSLETFDRDYLYFQICRFSIDDHVTFEDKCPDTNCGFKNTVKVAMDEVELFELPDPGSPECLYEIKKTGSGLFPYRKVWSAENSEFGINMKMKYDTVKESEKRSPRQNIIESSYDTYSDLLFEWIENGAVIEGPVSPNFWNNKHRKIIEWVDNEFISHTPGINPVIKYNCSSCGTENNYRLDFIDFLGKRKGRGQSGVILTKRSGG